MASVCIVADYNKDKIKSATLNAIGFGKAAAEKLGAALNLIVIGKDVKGIADQLAGYGAQNIYVVDDPAFEKYMANTWAQAIVQIAEACDAILVGMNSGTTGKDLMPRVAGKLEAGMASDVVGFDGRLFTREMWAGNALAEVEIVTEKKVVTIQSTAFDPPEPGAGTARIEPMTIAVGEQKTKVVDVIEILSDRPDLTEAGIVVTAGRGIKSGENMKLIEKLADFLNAGIGATRAVVDSGWATNDQQIGQTGKIVAPELYFAIGLSGSIQHVAGMKNSKVIVAINTDEEAPIFQIADYGLVADLFDAVPALTEKLSSEPRG